MKKTLSILLSFAMLLSITAGLDMSAYASISGDFEYELMDDGTAEITDYTGSATDLTIPSTLDGFTVTSIGHRAFADSANLDRIVKVTVPNSVTNIGGQAFCNCTSLESVTIPDSVTNIDGLAFWNTKYFNEEANWKNDVLYINKALIAAKESILGNYYVKNGTNVIAAGAFKNCASLTNLIISNKVVNIGYSAFYGCKGLNSISLSNSVKKIGADTFLNCTSLTDIYYSGTQAEWDSIISSYNNKDTVKNVTIHCNSNVPCEHEYTSDVTKATINANGSVVTKCSVCGYVSQSATIYCPKTITLSATSYTYDGKVKTPSVTVKDSKGKTLKKNTDYTVSYASGRKNVGKYAVTIKFKGNYSGTKTLYFTIKPKATSISSLTAGSKKFTVKWKKQSTQTTGYQIQYSTSSKFTNAKTVTVSKNSTTSKTISKLKSKKKYYVRVRTYKTVKVNGKSTKVYSSWSKAKSVTTKK
ncbi:MAG: leucine-rich repeat domain-containing protein [Eubacterium sp.]